MGALDAVRVEAVWRDADGNEYRTYADLSEDWHPALGKPGDEPTRCAQCEVELVQPESRCPTCGAVYIC